MKKIILFIFIILLNVSNVKAEEKTPMCQYVKHDGNVYNVELTVDSFSKQPTAYFYYIPNQPPTLVINYDMNYVDCNFDRYEPFSKLTAKQYMDEGNGCPDYLHFMYESTTGDFLAFFSNESAEKLKCNAIRESFSAQKYEIEEGENGELGVVDDISTVKYFGKIKGKEKEFDLIINKTQKTVSVSNSNFSLDFITYEEIVSADDKLLVFEDSNGSNYVFSSLEKVCEWENEEDKYCNFKHYDNCAYVYSKESNIIVMHEGCPPFFDYFSSKNIDGIKHYCSVILKNNNFSENKNSCINLCLNKAKELYENKYPSTQCGLSGRLILFIGKVVKWMKYLVPVIVIVLSIIDFIKATGADKEDEIKKAQNKFIRRLIIAALIFIIPFIIEFVLNKMGFDANGCGIIDL